MYSQPFQLFNHIHLVNGYPTDFTLIKGISKATSFGVNILLQTHQSDLKAYLSQVVLPSHHTGAPC